MNVNENSMFIQLTVVQIKDFPFLSCFIFETSLFHVCYSAQFVDAVGQRRIHALLKACLKFIGHGKRRKMCMLHPSG